MAVLSAQGRDLNGECSLCGFRTAPGQRTVQVDAKALFFTRKFVVFKQVPVVVLIERAVQLVIELSQLPEHF